MMVLTGRMSLFFTEYDANDNSIIFSYDWWEGEEFIRKIKVCHLEDIIFPDEVEE